MDRRLEEKRERIALKISLGAGVLFVISGASDGYSVKVASCFNGFNL